VIWCLEDQEHQVVAKDVTEAGGGAACVGAARPVSVRVGGELADVSSAQVKTGGEGALDVLENALDQREVRLAGIMHEQAYLLNSICQIRPCQGEVLEGTGETPVLGGVSNLSAFDTM